MQRAVVPPAGDRESFADASVCLLQTVGRVSHRPRVVELWFALEGGTIYFLAGGGARANWVRNLRREPRVRVRIRRTEFEGRARTLEPSDEERRARELVAAKYQGWRPGRPLSRWAATSLPVAVDIGP